MKTFTCTADEPDIASDRAASPWDVGSDYTIEHPHRAPDTESGTTVCEHCGSPMLSFTMKSAGLRSL